MQQRCGFINLFDLLSLEVIDIHKESINACRSYLLITLLIQRQSILLPLQIILVLGQDVLDMLTFRIHIFIIRYQFHITRVLVVILKHLNFLLVVDVLQRLTNHLLMQKSVLPLDVVRIQYKLHIIFLLIILRMSSIQVDVL